MRGMVCRQIPGMEKLARHAYEQSIAINPLQNDCLYNLANLIVDEAWKHGILVDIAVDDRDQNPAQAEIRVFIIARADGG